MTPVVIASEAKQSRPNGANSRGPGIEGKSNCPGLGRQIAEHVLPGINDLRPTFPNLASREFNRRNREFISARQGKRVAFSTTSGKDQGSGKDWSALAPTGKGGGEGSGIRRPRPPRAAPPA